MYIIWKFHDSTHFIFSIYRVSLPKVISIPTYLGFDDSLANVGLSALPTVDNGALNGSSVADQLGVSDVLDGPVSNTVDDTLPSSTQGFNAEPLCTSYITISR